MYRIAAKFGVAVFPDDGTDPDILYKNAEAALKKAKAGGHRHLFYTPKMTETVAQRLQLENKLRRAIDNQEFVLHYQPKVNLHSGEVTSVEALIRWNDPHTGLVPPGLFIRRGGNRVDLRVVLGLQNRWTTFALAGCRFECVSIEVTCRRCSSDIRILSRD